MYQGTRMKRSTSLRSLRLTGIKSTLDEMSVYLLVRVLVSRGVGRLLPSAPGMYHGIGKVVCDPRHATENKECVVRPPARANTGTRRESSREIRPPGWPVATFSDPDR